MYFSNCMFVCRFLEPARLPEFKGSLLRGMLGSSLRKASCALSRGDCPTCLLASRCVYSLAFEVPRGHGGGPTPPHPYLLEPPPAAQTDYVVGEELAAGLTLFGEMTRNLPYFIYAFERMGEDGIGASRERGLARFSLERVTCDGANVYDAGSKIMSALPEPHRLEVPLAAPQGQVSRLTLQLRTPLRIKHRNSFARELPFHLLVRAMLRRISSMTSHFGDGEPRLDYSGLVRRAKDVAVIEDATSWKDWTRFSSRQKQSMQFGGLVGTVVYEGDFGEYLPLLEACTVLHVGKQSVFGLGRIECSLEPLP